jgi:hypothetical protein
MWILSLLANLGAHPLPRPLRMVRWGLRLGLPLVWLYALVEGERIGREEAARYAEEQARQEAQYAAELAANAAGLAEFTAQLKKESEAYREKLDQDETAFYRSINTIRAYLGFEPVEEG